MVIGVSGGGVGMAEVGIINGVDEKWLIGWFECQKWRIQGAKIKTVGIDLMLF